MSNLSFCFVLNLARITFSFFSLLELLAECFFGLLPYRSFPLSFPLCLEIVIVAPYVQLQSLVLLLCLLLTAGSSPRRG